MMSYVKKTLNVFGIIAAIILSIVLVLVLTVTPFMFAAQMTFRPATIQKIMVQAASVADLELIDGLDEDLQQELVASNTFRDMLELYLEDLYAQASGEKGGLSSRDLRRVAKKNMDELVPLIRDIAKDAGFKDELPRKDDDLEDLVLDLVEEHGDEMLMSLPTLDDLDIEPLDELTVASALEVVEDAVSSDFDSDDMPQVATLAMLMFKNFLGLILMGILVVLLSLLVLLCRWGGLRGFTWLGADFILGSALGIGLSLFGKMLIAQMFIGRNAEEVLGMLQPTLNWLLIGGAGILVLGVAFAVTSAVGTKSRPKGENTEPVEVIP